MITSLSNPKIKNLIQLQKKAKVRREQQCFVVEGIKMVLEAPADRVSGIFVSSSFAQNDKNMHAVEQKAADAETHIEVVEDKIFRDISDTMTPQGVMAVVKLKVWDWKELLEHKRSGSGLYIILETLQDPGNLGTILRTGEGAGIDGVILNRTSVDPYMPKVIRSTMGSVYRMPIAIADDLTEVVQTMKSRQIHIYAAHLKGKKNYDRQDYRKDTCFMIGNEANGLSDTLADMATDYIKIPMAGHVESLNAGIAAALLMYEAGRQRDFK